MTFRITTPPRVSQRLVEPTRTPAATQAVDIKPRTPEDVFQQALGNVGAALHLDALHPDQAFDGHVVNLQTGKPQVFSLATLQDSVYTPAGAQGRPPLVFVEGANQWVEVGAQRARLHADQLGLPMVVVHNASFVREAANQPALRQKLNRLFEGVSNLALNKDLFSEQSARNVGAAMLDAVENGTPRFFAGESQGSILVGHAVRMARDAYVDKHAANSSAPARDKALQEFEEKAGKTLNVVTFGNAYASYARGPNYLHVMMRGDPVTNNGSRPDNRPADDRTRYLVFDQLFAGKNNFENHNIVFLTQLLKRSCELNNVTPGDLPALFNAVGAGSPFVVARPDEVAWPRDMQSQVWDSRNDVDRALQAYTATRAR